MCSSFASKHLISLRLCVAACFIWTAVNPVASSPPPLPSQGLLWLQVVRSLWEEMARIVSWHFSVFFFAHSCELLTEKEVCGFCALLLWDRWRDLTGWNQSSYSSLCPRMFCHRLKASNAFIYLLVYISLWQVKLMSVPMHVFSISTLVVSQPMQKKEGKSLLYNRFYVAYTYIFKIKRKMSNFRMLKLQEWIFPDGDGDAERQESLHYLLAQWPTGLFCQKALKLAATHMHTYTRTWPLWFSTQTKTATAKMQMLSGEKWGGGGGCI